MINNPKTRRRKPVTSSSRYVIQVDKRGLSKEKPFKPLTKGKINKAGRNAHGRITAKYRGGGHKRKYREIDMHMKEGKYLVTREPEYDPNRSAFIILKKDMKTNKHSYDIAVNNVAQGSIIESSDKCDIQDGNTMKLKSIPDGTIICRLTDNSTGKACMARSAGTSAKVVGRRDNYVLVQLPSSEVKAFSPECRATIGTISNAEHKNESIGKAGRSRWNNRRPRTRAVAMNPIDHPMGGGEGKSSGGRHPVSRSGIPAKGYKTRDKNKRSSKLIVSRRVNRKRR